MILKRIYSIMKIENFEKNFLSERRYFFQEVKKMIRRWGIFEVVGCSGRGKKKRIFVKNKFFVGRISVLKCFGVFLFYTKEGRTGCRERG